VHKKIVFEAAGEYAADSPAESARLVTAIPPYGVAFRHDDFDDG
jgi:hypothetical protein